MCFFAAIGLAAFLLFGIKGKQTLAALTGVLAVIAAVISAWPALRVLEIQEDSLQPRPTPYFDLTSRYNLLLLRVKNIGLGVAYDLQLTWNTHPRNEEGEEVSALDFISVLTPQDSVSVMVGRPQQLFQKYSTMRFEVTFEFRDAAKKKMRAAFVVSADEHRKRLVHDDELPKTLYELQQIPGKLDEIGKEIRKIQPTISSTCASGVEVAKS